MDIERLDFDKLDGLIPAIIQHASTREVLMLGFMNREALERTLADGLVTFWSRSRARLWKKGETSGNTLAVVSISADCDHDTLLVLATPSGPTCHTGAVSCFVGEDDRTPSQPVVERGAGFINQLQRTIVERHREMPDGSYTADLFRAGRSRIAQKVGEEGVEVVIAAIQADTAALPAEAADLLYHLIVLLVECGYRIEDVEGVLRSRALC